MKKIALFVPDLRGGGAEKTVMKLANGFAAKQFDTTVIMASASGVYLDQLMPSILRIDLKSPRVLSSIIPLGRWLLRNRPDVLISHLGHANLAALLAIRFIHSSTKLLLVEHAIVSREKMPGLKGKIMLFLMRLLYRKADAVVAVSKSATVDLQKYLQLSPRLLHTIYNPVVDSLDEDISFAVPAHPWLVKKTVPVYLAAGRLVPEKGFDNLLRAFALVRKHTPCRLIVLGDGPLLEQLQGHADELQIKDDVSFPGFVKDAGLYMANADCFVCSSSYEGLSNVIIEALACGCKVVSFDCPGGPREILEEGKFGALVAAGDVVGLAEAMKQSIAMMIDRNTLVARGKYFSVDRSVSAYIELVEQITNSKTKE